MAITCSRPGVTEQVSVIIPTRNPGEGLKTLLETLFKQKCELGFEVIIIDSGSTDGSLSFCQGYPVRLIQIERHDFHHARTRNVAIGAAHGEYCVLTVQDAIPCSENWLSSLVMPAHLNEEVAGVFGQQVSRDNATLLSRSCKVNWYNSWSQHYREQQMQAIPKGLSWESLGLETQKRLARFDNVNGCIKKSVWQNIPFPDVPYAEDVAWAIEALKNHYTLCWQPDAQVFHSHNRTLGYELKRSFVESVTMAALFGDFHDGLTRKKITTTVNWLHDQAKRYAGFTSLNAQSVKSKPELFEEMERGWEAVNQMIKTGNSIAFQPARSEQNQGQVETLFTRLTGFAVGNSVMRKLYRLLSEYSGRFLHMSRLQTLLMLELKSRHRVFFEQLLTSDPTLRLSVQGQETLRIGAAMMVAGSYLGQQQIIDSVPSFEFPAGQQDIAADESFWARLEGLCGMKDLSDVELRARLNALMSEQV